MICPQCGYDIGNNSKCLRCGYVVKTVATVDESKRKENDKNEPDTKVIDPRNVYISSMDDEYSDPFSSIFDDIFGDPITSLLGGLFGFDMFGGVRHQQRQQEEPPKKKKKQGPVVEVNNVEFLDENNNPISSDKASNKKNNRKQ